VDEKSRFEGGWGLRPLAPSEKLVIMRCLSESTKEAIRKEWQSEPERTSREVVQALAVRGIAITYQNADYYRPFGLPPKPIEAKGPKTIWITAKKLEISESKRRAIEQAWAANPRATVIEIDLWLRRRGVKFSHDSVISQYRPIVSIDFEEIEEIDNRSEPDPTIEEIEQWKKKIKSENSKFDA
jgi:hypothetical protein